jgi:hypothetical protein
MLPVIDEVTSWLRHDRDPGPRYRNAANAFTAASEHVHESYVH